MNRGEVWWVRATAAIGGETRGDRPGIIVSNDASNRVLNRVQVIPVTRNAARAYPGEAVVRVRGEEQKALATQILTVDKSRLVNRLAVLSVEDMRNVDRALRVQLGLA